MPRVVINAGILSFVIKTPFTNPRKEATIKVKRTAPTPPIYGIKEDPRTPTKESIEPTDISKSPFIIQKAMPMEPIPIKEVNRNVLTKLKVVRNGGDKTENTTRRPKKSVGSIKVSNWLNNLSFIFDLLLLPIFFS
jgi:hypothetical protein